MAVAPRDQTKTATTSVAQARNTSPGEPAGPNQTVLKAQGKAAAQSRGTILTKPEDIFRHELGSVEGGKEKYAALTEDQRSQFDKLIQSQMVEGTEVNTAPPKFGGMAGGAKPQEMSDQERAALVERAKGTGARQGLIALLAAGKLTEKDSGNESMLENLTQLQSKPVAEGLDQNNLVRGVIQDTAFSPPQSGNVATGELNKSLARNNPAEYARVIGDLASPEGKANLGSSELTAKPLPEKPKGMPSMLGFGASDSSQLFQNSMSESTARTELFRNEVSENPERSAAYDRLSARDQRKLQIVYQDTIPHGDYPKPPGSPGGMVGMMMNGGKKKTEMPKLSEAEIAEQKKAMTDFHAQQGAIRTGSEARGAIGSLLQKGTLSDKDSKGRSLMDNLYAIRGQEMASEDGHTLDGKQIMSEVIHQIDDPGSIRQNNKGTCTVTTVEHLLATRQPSEYARVMGALTSKSGDVTLQDGTKVPREKGIVPPDDSHRTNTSRIFQATMMEYGNGDKEDYRNAEDGHYKTGSGEAILNYRGELSSGLQTRGEWERVSDSVLGTNSEVHMGTLRGGSRAKIDKRIGEALADDRTVQVGLRWRLRDDGKHSYHALSVTGQDDEYVYLRNPHGSGDQGATDGTKTLVREALRPAETGQTAPPGFASHGFGSMAGNDDRPIADGRNSTGEAGSIRVKKDEFYAKLSDFLVEEKPPEPKWYDRFNPFSD